jgi:hypothetical protein
MPKYGGVSNDAVSAKTGRGWDEWFTLLDRTGAKEMPHRDIATLLREKYGVPEWWSQMVTVGYEQARGLRAVHEKEGGFSASVSKTFAAPVSRIFTLWSDEEKRTQWLGSPPLEVRKETLNRSMRISWNEADGSKTRVDVYFYEKGPEKCQVALQHEHLPGPAAVDEKKGYWKAAFAKLESMAAG